MYACMEHVAARKGGVGLWWKWQHDGAEVVVLCMCFVCILCICILHARAMITSPAVLGNTAEAAVPLFNSG